MRITTKVFAVFSIFIFAAGGFSYAAAADIAGLVDDFQKATDLQRGQIIADNSGKGISTGGTVSNVGEYDFFDIVSDIKGTYYQVSTQQQMTKNNVPYQVIFLLKDKDLVKDISKGQAIQKDGRLIRITDERLQISVWILCGDLAEKDKALFKQDLSN